jgi:heat-inducible transcriptional repressor
VASRRSLDPSLVNERAQHFLKVLIERYIREGEPVGSRTLARDAGMDLSPATIRNVMADLEEQGLIESPHTSAGRVPTVIGYRLFVDSLVTLKPVERQEVEQLRGRLGSRYSPPELLETASELLSSVTHMAGLVLIPRREQFFFRQLEFLPLSENRVLAILVTREQEVINQIIKTQREYSRSELEEASNFLNREFSGRTLAEVRERLVQGMRENRAEMDRVMRRALEMADAVLAGDGGKEDLFISGQTNLMDFSELTDLRRLRELFETFNKKHEILHLLDACLHADGMQIYIGEESGYRELDQCSLVTAPYEVDGRVVGVLGVIGPTRMAYDRVIPLVDITAKLLGAALKAR